MAKKTKEKKSKTKEEKPKIAEEKPKIAEEKPKIAEEKPKIAEEKPKIAEEKPKIAEEEPKIAEEEPKIAEEEPKIAEEEPKIAEEEPKIAEEKRIILFIEWEGFTKEMYEEARKQVNLDGDIPKGLVSHFVAFDKKDIRVTDIWESEEEFNNYIQNRLMPVTGNLIETKPKIEIFPLYTLFVPVKESS